MLRRRDLEVLTTTLFEASAISFEAAASTDDVFWQLLYSRVLTTQILSETRCLSRDQEGPHEFFS